MPMSLTKVLSGEIPMLELPTPHKDKLKALLNNPKLPVSDRTRVMQAIARYEKWLSQLQQVSGTSKQAIGEMVALLNNYRLYLDVDVVFDSPNDFLYRQKGQLKLDNSVIEEFLPLLITTILSSQLRETELSFGPTNCFSGLRFESSIREIKPGGGLVIRSKAQDFAISRKLYISASHSADFQQALREETHIAYVVAECKTNLDKTMFQEAAATALDVKTAVPAAKYYLLCEWLDMTPISASATAIDEIIILRKSKRLASNIREQFNTRRGRKNNREFYAKYLRSHPLAADTFARFVSHIRNLFRDGAENSVLARGYF
jgi:hypothetical protein